MMTAHHPRQQRSFLKNKLGKREEEKLRQLLPLKRKLQSPEKGEPRLKLRRKN
jgi:hypothetical protein